MAVGLKEEQANDTAEFERRFEEAGKQETSLEQEKEGEDLSAFESQLGRDLRVMFGEYEVDRLEKENDWIKDLRQYRGEYDPETLKKFHPKRSKAFLSLTRTKVNTVSSRMTDLLFPANKDKNYGVKPSPVPELNPVIIQNLIAQYAAETGEDVTEEFIKEQINKEATRRCEAMEQEIDDQLSELRYRHIVREVLKDGHSYGTGVLKGPLVKRRVSKRYIPHGEEWVTVDVENYSPWCEHVSLWDFYPDMSARNIDNCRGIFQRHVMPRHRLLQLSKRTDFNAEAIKAYLSVYKQGDASYKNFEQDLMSMNRSGTESSTGYKETSAAGTAGLGVGSPHYARQQKFEVLEFWGYISSEDLSSAGVKVDDELSGMDVAANIWILGNIVIKAAISSIDGAKIPYHLYYYDKDDTSIFAEGIPKVMRDAQKLFNAAVRAMLDNAAIAAGPIIEVNTDLLDINENPKDIYPFRVYLRDGMGMEAGNPAVRVYEVKSHTREFMEMIQFFTNAADEVTSIPRYLYGDNQNVGGAGQTASGLSMLMGAANVNLKDQVKNYDDGVTKPFIKGMYFWNMDFNSKEHIKGDFSVIARGSTSLIAREVRSEALAQFLAITANPEDQRYIKRWNALREYVKLQDIDDMDLIKDENTIKLQEAADAKQMEEDRQFQKQLALIKASSGGHMESALAAGLGPDQTELSPSDVQQGEDINVPQ